MSMWDRIEQARAEWNVLEYPSYQRWSSGELSREELTAAAVEAFGTNWRLLDGVSIS